MAVVTVPCQRHGRHDLVTADAAKVIAVLSAAITFTVDDDASIQPGHAKGLTCAREALDWATDSELLREQVDAMFEPTGYDPFEEA